MNHEQKVAIITGGTRGIGRQVAARLSQQSYALALNYAQDDSSAEQALVEIKSSGRPAMTFKADIADTKAMSALFDAVDHEFGGVDLVVNAAGIIGVTAPVIDTDLELFDRIVHTNIRGTFVVAQHAANRLRPSGSLITFSSSATRLARPGSAAYTMSKGAVEALTLLLARELRGRDIRVNTIAPGVIGTDLFERFLEGRPEVRSELIAASPMNRLGMPDDIASVVAFLASSEGQWVNGQVIYVNGGAA